VEPESTQEPAARPPDPADPPDPGEAMVRALKTARRNQFRAGLGLGVIVTAAIIVLIVQNGSSARISWLGLHFGSPLWIMLLLTAAAGAVAWEVVKAFVRRARRLRRQNREAVRAAQVMTRQ
jgi:uncharacterized integral membrane protein